MLRTKLKQRLLTALICNVSFQVRIMKEINSNFEDSSICICLITYNDHFFQMVKKQALL